MKRGNRVNLIIVALILLNFALLYRLLSSNKYIDELQQAISVINENQVIARGQKDKLFSDVELSFIDWGKKLNDFDSLLLKKKSLLVLRVHPNNCNECVSQSLVYINRLIAKGDDLPFDLLVSTSYENLDLLRQDFDLKFMSIKFTKRLELELDFTSKPYFFVVNPDGRISNLFVPEYDMMELFIAYLNSIVRGEN